MTTVDAALVSTGAKILYPKDGRMVIVITNTAGATKDIVIAAGNGLHAGMGAVTRNLAATTGSSVIGPLSSSRFKDSNGYINISFGSGMTGQIAAIRLP